MRKKRSESERGEREKGQGGCWDGWGFLKQGVVKQKCDTGVNDGSGGKEIEEWEKGKRRRRYPKEEETLLVIERVFRRGVL